MFLVKSASKRLGDVTAIFRDQRQPKIYGIFRFICGKLYRLPIAHKCFIQNVYLWSNNNFKITWPYVYFINNDNNLRYRIVLFIDYNKKSYETRQILRIVLFIFNVVDHLNPFIFQFLPFPVTHSV